MVDTNVLVSALIGSRPDSPPKLLLRAMLSGELRYLLSADLLAEYSSVAQRPKLLRLHGLSTVELDALLWRVACNARTCAPARATVAPSDPGDQMVIDILVEQPEATLVCGDGPLTASARGLGFATLSPREWVDSVAQRL